MRRRSRARWGLGGVCIVMALLVVFWPSQPDSDTTKPSWFYTLDNSHTAGSEKKLIRKHQIVNDLVGGKLTLGEAVDRCLELNRDYPHLADIEARYFAKHFPGDMHDERLARNLIEYSQGVLVGDPCVADEVNSRLDAELTAFVRP